MGLIKAGLGSVGGALADTWKEVFYAEALDKNTLCVKGSKKTGKRTSNTKGEDNVITSGSGIIVSDGQCMLIVEQGKIVDICAEPGEYTYDNTIAPSIFLGGLREGLKKTFEIIGKRFAMGGDTGIDQRIYYFNTKEIIDNKFGTPNPIPFRIIDKNINLDIDVSIRCSGVFSYKISDPMLFYKNVCGNVEKNYMRSEIDEQLKTEFISALQPAFGKLSSLGLRPNEIINHNTDIENAMNETLSNKWSETRGIDVVSIAIGTLTLPESDQQLIKDAQRAGMLRDPNMSAATLVGAQADAMKAAANNQNGAVSGFMGMGMAMNMGVGEAAKNLFQMGQNQNNNNTWTCSCGQVNTGNFCQNCGNKKP